MHAARVRNACFETCNVSLVPETSESQQQNNSTARTFTKPYSSKGRLFSPNVLFLRIGTGSGGVRFITSILGRLRSCLPPACNRSGLPIARRRSSTNDGTDCVCVCGCGDVCGGCGDDGASSPAESRLATRHRPRDGKRDVWDLRGRSGIIPSKRWCSRGSISFRISRKSGLLLVTLSQVGRS